MHSPCSQIGTISQLVFNIVSSFSHTISQNFKQTFDCSVANYNHRISINTSSNRTGPKRRTRVEVSKFLLSTIWVLVIRMLFMHFLFQHQTKEVILVLFLDSLAFF